MRYLSNKEKKQLKEKLPKGFEIEKKDEIKEKENIIYKNGEKYLIFDEKQEKYIPHLNVLNEKENEKEFKSVYVDKGAIPFILKGADLMRPGIVEIEEGFEKNELVLIKDINHKKTIAIGYSMYNSKELKEIEKGKVIKVIHYINDKLY